MFFNQPLSSRILSQLALVAALLFTVAPLVLIVRQSLDGQGPLNYWIIFSTTPLLTFARNSALVAGCTVILVTALALSAAYAIELLRPRGSRWIYALILGGLTLPPIALVVPLFNLIQGLGLENTLFAVILPLTALAIPFGVLLSANYIRELPIEVYEAAKIDGASTFRFLRSILLPLCVPILSVVAVFTFLSAWNEYVLPLIFLQDIDTRVATQVPAYFSSERQVDTPKIFAANVLISLPVIFIYLLLQGVFRKGLAGGAVK